MILDRHQKYFSEKLWQLIPEAYRHEDGLAENPGVLRALVEILAREAARLRWGHDRLWENQFIETCEDWAIPYLGDLVGSRPLSGLNARGARVDVAKTVYYRRRKGTLPVLEQLISDIAGWEGKVTEAFRRLGRSWHGLDGAIENGFSPGPGLELLRPSGTSVPIWAEGAASAPWTAGAWHTLGSQDGVAVRTPMHGLAHLKNTLEAQRSDTPFGSFSHTPDLRRPQGTRGLWGIPKIIFDLYRRPVHRLEGVQPYALEPGRYRFDPSGRDIPLHSPRGRADDWDAWRPARPWELPAPIPCRLLGQECYRITGALMAALVADHGVASATAEELRPLLGRRHYGEGAFIAALEALPSAALWTGAQYAVVLDASLEKSCGKGSLWNDAVLVENAAGPVADPGAGKSASLAVWGPAVSFPDKTLLIDPERGRYEFPAALPESPITVTYHVGQAFAVGAGTYDRAEVELRDPDGGPSGGGGALNFDDIGDTGVSQIPDSATYGPVGNKLSVLNLTVQASNQERPYLLLESDWILNTSTHEDSQVLLDGLWVGCVGDERLILRGNYETVTLKHCTLDPGGERDPENPGATVAPLILEVDGFIETLVLEKCVIGAIHVNETSHVESIRLSQCIWQMQGQAADPLEPLLDVDHGELHLSACTVMGDIRCQALWATDTLVDGLVTVENQQTGCFRYSGAREGSRLPRPHVSVTLPEGWSLFQSRRFGDPGYGQLRDHLPATVLRGGANACEMGVGNGFIPQARFQDLQTKVAEYLPFGLVPAYVFRS